MRATGTLIACAFLCTAATGETTTPPAEAPPAANGTAEQTPVCCVLAALTPVRIEILATLNSRLSKIGDHFPIRLAAPVEIAPGLQLPAGIEGSGDVVHAAKGGFAGRPGELLLAVRYLEYRGARIPLRSLSFVDDRGKDRGNTAFALAVAGGLVGGVAAMFITGGEVNIPAGTIAYAKTSAPVALSAGAATDGANSPQQGGGSK